MGITVLILLLFTTLLGLFRDKLVKKEYRRTRFDVFINKYHLERIDVAIIFICLVCTGFQIGDLICQNNKDNKIERDNSSILRKQYDYQDSLRKNIDSLKSSNYHLIQINEAQRTSIDVQSELIRQLQGQARNLDDLGRKQLHLTNYMHELNHEIRTIFFRVKLKKEVAFAEICPLKLGFEFNPSDKSSFRFRILVNNAEAKTGNSSNPMTMVSYNILDASFEDTARITNHYTEAYREVRLLNIVIPVYLTEDIKDVVKNFHDESFIPRIQNSLIDKIDSLELIVNGWSILSVSTKDVFWRKEISNWVSLIDNEIPLFIPITNPKGVKPPSALWRINVYNKFPNFYKNLSYRDYPPSLVKGRRFRLIEPWMF